ncbi:hypothetical protein DCAR_0209702 [Daucus carota subsp. sativus]|uniref:DUF4378 domain-containing protein n=1 Tax=Daucus carota subsp. sativus TaxID=79200 RepID=A0AAF0WLK3_DAUCS|nr:hypothetical protein DCAR_0209702 [Daucus carota subsp. sativus]
MTSQLVPIGQKPRMLKDFLADNSHSKRVSFFQDNLNMTFSNSGFSKFLIKYLPFTTNIKPPSILPRSITKRLSKSRSVSRNVNMKELTAKVKVKDILRWRSFRDLAEVESQPLNFSSSPHHCTTVTTTTGSTSMTSNSGRSSWCDSDFTAEDLPSWCSNSVTPKGKWLCDEEKEQNSPVSVLDCFSEEDEESKQAGTTELFVNKTHKHEEPENRAEEKAMQLLNQVKTNISGYLEVEEEFLLLDFFSEQLTENKKGDYELTKVANEWIKGEDEGCLEWKLVGKKEFSIRDMERGVKWNKFDEDEQELGLEIEKQLLNCLVDEVLFDFLDL